MSFDINLDPFAQLPEYITKNIINDSGNLRNVAKVSRILRYEAWQKAEAIVCDIFTKYDKDLLVFALKGLRVSPEASTASVVEVFFKLAKTFSIKTKASDPYHFLHLAAYMQICAEIKDLDLFYSAIYKVASPSLKTLMDNMILEEHPLARFGQIRSFFKEQAQELAKIESLNLGHFSLSSLPNEIALCTNLKILVLSDNKLDSFPSILFRLNHLSYLDLNQNNMTELPDEIGDLKNLKFLYLNNNKIEKLPLRIGDLVNLQDLCLNDNLLSYLPNSISKLKSLSLLSMTGNRLKQLPDSIGDLINLKLLHLSDNEIVELPKTIGKLKSLNVLSIANNHLVMLPTEIAGMTSLTTLVVSQNSLLSLPRELVSMPNLEELYANDNRFRFPYRFTRLTVCIAEANEDIAIFKSKHPYQVNKEMFETIYDGLNQSKWKECVDGGLQVYGKNVFDQGLHGGPVEPGFMSSMESAFEFLRENFHRKLDASFYLDLHQAACAHFQGPHTGTMVGQERVGVFRGASEPVSASFEAPDYAMYQEAMNEFYSLSAWISDLFGPSFSLGLIVPTSDFPKKHQINYHMMSEDQVKIVFNFFLSIFHSEMNQTKTHKEVLPVIARLIQRLEWLHPVQDGCGRTDTALLNFLLTKYGFTPCLLQFPYLSSCRGFSEWVDYLTDGMNRWSSEANEGEVIDMPSDGGEFFEDLDATEDQANFY